MTTLEQVEKLREKTDLSYEEAKAVLDSVDGDLLEALVKLENEGRIAAPSNGTYRSDQGKQQNAGEKKEYYTPPDDDGVSFGQVLGKIGAFCGKLFQKGNSNYLDVRRYDKTLVSVPLTVVVILVVFAFWITIPLMIVGLFMHCRYVFVGKDIEKTPANNAMDAIANTAETIKSEVTNSTQNQNNNHTQE
ncbi:MAG: DUF4342 domain-containing protein [Bacillota bacterium]|nr:DUF4342 domain-containing protein [Bacillota bacterium]